MSSPAPVKATEIEVRRLLKRLARAKDDWPSEPSLHYLSPQMVDALLSHAERQAIDNTRHQIFITAFLLLFMWLSHGNPSGLYGSLFTIIILVAMAAIIKLRQRTKNTVYVLTQTRDMRVLPTLIKATSNDWGNHPQVIGAICRLLQQITEADAGRLSQKMQNRLWAWAIQPARLGPEYNEVLVTSVLQAFAHVGSRETLSRMQRFTNEPATSPSYPSHRRVNALINEIIPAMEERLQRQEVPQTLLRASDASDAQPDTLLRAAHTTSTEPTAQLLRASTSETSDETSLT